MSRDFSLFTVAVGDGIVVVSSLVVGEALGDGDVDDGDVEADEVDDDEPDGVDEGVAEDEGDGLGDGDEDMADDDDDGVDDVVDEGDGVVDEDDDVDDVDDGGVASVLRWQPEAAARASAAARTRGIDRTVMRISGDGDRDARHPMCGK